jgi:HK97 gp10 family phage protein
MARFNAELPNDLIKEFESLGNNAEKMMSEMTKAGAEVVYKLVKSNMSKSFKTTKALEKGLKMTKVYKTPSTDGIGVYIGFYGYDTSKRTKKYPNGVPIPLIANAREYGTSKGEAKKPFFRKSFNKKQVEEAMLKVQGKYIKGD